jgi:hypothetical protein
MRLCAELWLVYMLAADYLKAVGPQFRRAAQATVNEALDAYFDAVERELASANCSNKIWVCFGIGCGFDKDAHR